MIAKRLRWTGRKLEFVLVFALSGLLTVFILASSYETAFGKDLPYINAVNAVNLSFMQPDPTRYIDTTDPANGQSDTAKEGTYGAPFELKTSTSQVRIQIAAPLYDRGNWLARASTAHYFIASKAKGANIGDLVLYMRSSVTTIQQPGSLKAGDNIFVDTKKGWRYLYRIDETIIVNPATPYILSSSAKSRVYVVDQISSQQTYVIAGTLLNVQNAEQ